MRLGCLILLILLFPSAAIAACLERGATVIYVNGIFTNLTTAQKDLNKLRDEYIKITNDKTINFYNGYNPSHLAGVGDVTQAALQTIGLSVSNYDLNTILLQIHPQVQTRRLLLIGHSQGGFYTNAMHQYLLAHGEPKESIGVYNIGTPSNTVAGGGKYLSSANDTLLNLVEHFSGIYLARNINIPILPDDVGSTFAGHGISRAYLAGAPERVVGDMQGMLATLEPTYASDTGTCFTPPDRSLGYQAQHLLYAVADPSVSTAVAAAGVIKNATVAAAQGVYGAVASTFAALTPEPRTENLPGSFSIVEALYGSSLTEAEVRELLGPQQGSAVAVALQHAPNLPASLPPPPKRAGVVAGVETESPQSVVPHIPPSNLMPVPNSPGYGGGGGSIAQNTSAPPPSVEDTNVQEAVPEVPEPQPETEPESETEENVEEETEEIVEESEEVLPPEEVVEEPDTSEEPQVTPDGLIVLASQSDDSFGCLYPEYPMGWRSCYTNDTSQLTIDLGLGSQYMAGAIHSVTIATQAEFAPTADTTYWSIYIHCYVDAAYTVPCPDWARPAAYNGLQTHLIAHKASLSDDQKYWTALFTDPVHSANFDNSAPVVFNPNYYYRLLINDSGWSIGAYGSPTAPYFVLYGTPISEETEVPIGEEEEESVAQPVPGEVFVLASQLDDSQHCVFDWRPCYTQDGRHAFINLGSGAQFANGSLHSVTVASDSSEWIAQVRCYTDSAYASLCSDWVTSQIWNGFTTYQTADFANVSAGGNRWTALFTEPVNHKNSDGSHPVVFRPEYYYQLVIDDDGLTNGAYGSPTTPFFILYGLAPTPEE